MHKPPHRSQESDTRQDNAIIVHCRNGDWKRVREAEYDVKENDRDDRNTVDRVSHLAHPEGALRKVLAARE